MSAMKLELYADDYYTVQANHGETHIVPVSVCGHLGETDIDPAGLADYIDGKIDLRPDGTADAELLTGYVGRYQMPGYLDCTDWSADADAETLAAELRDLYGDDDDDTDDDE